MDLLLKKIKPPFIPKIRNELDTSNFAEEFTKMAPTDSPAIVPPNFDKIFKVSATTIRKQFIIKRFILK